MEYYSAINKDRIMAFGGKYIMLSEISQVQKDKSHVFSLFSLSLSLSLSLSHTHTHTHTHTHIKWG
jgi:hypothetical protein